MFVGADIGIIRTPVRAPRANAIAERFIGALRRMLACSSEVTRRPDGSAVISYEQTPARLTTTATPSTAVNRADLTSHIHEHKPQGSTESTTRVTSVLAVEIVG